MISPLQPGQKVGAGRFTLVRPLGRGGMGEVWLAQDERLGEQVALKFLPPEVRADPVALDDLRRETARSHRLTHPSIVRIHDLHEEPGGLAFIAMEYVDGPTLSSLRLEQAGRVLSWDTLKPLVEQLCAALDYAHGEKVIHRDLKPANVMVDGKGRLKLADFGIAATVSDSVSRVSGRHNTSGTLPYMSPQQLTGKRPQVADDIYALGATLYELLTSKPPFYTGDITHQVLHEPPEALDERMAGLEIQNPMPADVAAIVMACLAKEPAQRPQSVGAVAAWIGLKVVAKPSVETLTEAMFPRAGVGPETTPAEQPAVAGSSLTTRRGKLRIIMSGAVALLLVGAAEIWYSVEHRARDREAKPAANPVEAPKVSRAMDAAAARLQTGPGGSFELAKRPSGAFTGALPDTIWLVKDSAGDSYCFQFLGSGVLNYEAGRGVRSNGKWESEGGNVDLDINNGYAHFSRKISGRKITGEARSKNGQTWTWEGAPKE